MRIKSRFIESLHLDQKYGLLTARQLNTVMTYFAALDFRGAGWLDDAQFRMFMRATTDLTDSKIDNIFDLLDADGSSRCEFDEFYLLISIMIAIKDNQQKQFMNWHWRTCFELLDADNSKTVSPEEFKTLGSLLGFGSRSVRHIFEQFDINGNRELDIEEFHMFTLACIDEEAKLIAKKANKKSLLPWRKHHQSADTKSDSKPDDDETRTTKSVKSATSRKSASKDELLYLTDAEIDRKRELQRQRNSSVLSTQGHMDAFTNGRNVNKTDEGDKRRKGHMQRDAHKSVVPFAPSRKSSRGSGKVLPLSANVQ